MYVKELHLTITVVNSFIGVSLLTLPFCFQQCGIILGSLLLICCSWLAYSSSLMLIEAAIVAKRKTYFGLAQISYGIPGKLVVEICMIGLLMGTCIAFFVVLEDLGANLFLVLTGYPSTLGQRALLLLTITSVVVLPLCLEKEVSDSAWQSLISVIFYMLLMIVLLVYCLNSVLSGELVLDNVSLWQWSGIATCLPIFATSFCCHPLVLPMYFNLRGQSVERMNIACKQATITTFTFYTLIGLCGYLPLTEAVPGDILAALPPSFVTHERRWHLLSKWRYAPSSACNSNSVDSVLHHDRGCLGTRCGDCARNNGNHHGECHLLYLSVCNSRKTTERYFHRKNPSGSGNHPPAYPCIEYL
ncbi:solute carrier family 38 member 10-like isoform X3 [Heterodontus francisci]|uniref:solute carrier family 38 member 10-like isoform X3 n=1 Tax=Heterodontus francisci TaxID=7792 RepID=UPI00355B2017